MLSLMARVLLIGACLAGAVSSAAAAQRTVRISGGWIAAPAADATEAMAFLAVDNGTMYDVYVVGVESEAAGVVELRQAVKGGQPATVKEATVPSFGQLEMAAEGLYIHLGALQRPLKAGDTVAIVLTLDNGTTLQADAAVK